MQTWSAVALALALSIDGLAVGVAYGMRRIRVPVRSLLMIGLCSAACFAVALMLGDVAAAVIGLGAPHFIGAAILIGLGLWHIGKGWEESRAREAAAGAGDHGAVPDRDRDGSSDFGTLLRIRVRGLGIVVQVLREPGRADLDRSGAIDVGEAVVLGTALGLDALAAGFGAAFVGFGFSVVAVVACAQLLVTWFGLWLGREHGARWLGEKGFYVPGVILILIGLLQL